MSKKQSPIDDTFVDAEACMFTSACPNRGRHGIAFSAPPFGILHFAISPESAAFLRRCLDEYPGLQPVAVDIKGT
jgi:hypothetical protein